MNVVALALAAAITYGGADFFGGLAGRRAAILTVVVATQFIGLLTLLVFLPFGHGTFEVGDVRWALACGLAGAVAIALFYRGLAIGTMGVVSPISAIIAALIPIGFGLVRGEHPGFFALIGMVCALLAVAFVSVGGKSDPSSKNRTAFLAPGLLEAIAAGIAFGFFFVALAQTSRDGGFYPLIITRFVSLAIAASAALVVRVPLIAARESWPTLVACGVLDMSANMLYVLASHLGLLSIAAVLSSLYPAATVALAAIVLGERLTRTQSIGVLAAIIGVALIAAT